MFPTGNRATFSTKGLFASNKAAAACMYQVDHSIVIHERDSTAKTSAIHDLGMPMIGHFVHQGSQNVGEDSISWPKKSGSGIGHPF